MMTSPQTPDEGYNLQIKLSMPRSANLWKVIHCLMKEESLVALKLRDQAIATTSDSSPNSARRSKKERRKAVHPGLQVWGDGHQGLDGSGC